MLPALSAFEEFKQWLAVAEKVLGESSLPAGWQKWTEDEYREWAQRSHETATSA